MSSRLFVSDGARQTLGRLLKKNYLKTNQLGFEVFDEAIIMPVTFSKEISSQFWGGVLSKDYQFIASTNFNEEQTESPILNIDTNNLLDKKRKAIYLGLFHHVYGHCITDNLKRLWFLYSKEGRELIKDDIDFVYVTINGNPLPEYAEELFRLADVDCKRLKHISSLTRYEKVYIPDSSLYVEKNEVVGMRLCRVYTKEYAEVIERIRSKIEIKEYLPSKVYFSRSYLKDNLYRESGEREIEKVFKKRGYTIVAPEHLPIMKQLELLKNCKTFVATEGSVAHNAVFCNPNTEVVILRKSNYFNSYQFVLNQVAKVQPYYIDAFFSCPPYLNGHEWIGPFYLGVTEYLKNFIGYSSFCLPRWFKLSWWMYYLPKQNWFVSILGNRKIYHKFEIFVQRRYNKTCEITTPFVE